MQVKYWCGAFSASSVILAVASECSTGGRWGSNRGWCGRLSSSAYCSAWRKEPLEFIAQR
jgi:hypothetical protein